MKVISEDHKNNQTWLDYLDEGHGVSCKGHITNVSRNQIKYEESGSNYLSTSAGTDMGQTCQIEVDSQLEFIAESEKVSESLKRPPSEPESLPVSFTPVDDSCSLLMTPNRGYGSSSYFLAECERGNDVGSEGSAPPLWMPPVIYGPFGDLEVNSSIRPQVATTTNEKNEPSFLSRLEHEDVRPHRNFADFVRAAIRSPYEQPAYCMPSEGQLPWGQGYEEGPPKRDTRRESSGLTDLTYDVSPSFSGYAGGIGDLVDTASSYSTECSQSNKIGLAQDSSSRSALPTDLPDGYVSSFGFKYDAYGACPSSIWQGMPPTHMQPAPDPYVWRHRDKSSDDIATKPLRPTSESSTVERHKSFDELTRPDVTLSVSNEIRGMTTSPKESAFMTKPPAANFRMQETRRTQLWSCLRSDLGSFLRSNLDPRELASTLQDRTTDDYVSLYTRSIQTNVLCLSWHVKGCRLVQSCLDYFPLKLRNAIATECKGQVLRLLESPSGNHVLQKLIQTVDDEHVNALVAEIEGQVHYAAAHCFGCRIIQRVLERNSSNCTTNVLADVIGNAINLSLDQYGNYVIQHICEHGTPSDQRSLALMVCKNMLLLSTHRYSSNVVEKCIQNGNRNVELAQMLIDAILVGLPLQSANSTSLERLVKTPLYLLMKDRYGNYVIQKMLTMKQPNVVNKLHQVLSYMTPLFKRIHYGRHVLSALEATSPKGTFVNADHNGNYNDYYKLT